MGRMNGYSSPVLSTARSIIAFHRSRIPFTTNNDCCVQLHIRMKIAAAFEDHRDLVIPYFSKGGTRLELASEGQVCKFYE
jgi:hypothetical protein